MDLLGPRSKERLFKMHKDIINPKPADSLASVLHTIEDWEGELKDYYRCGGTHTGAEDQDDDREGLLPADTPASVHVASNCKLNHPRCNS